MKQLESCVVRENCISRALCPWFLPSVCLLYTLKETLVMEKIKKIDYTDIFLHLYHIDKNKSIFCYVMLAPCGSRPCLKLPLAEKFSNLLLRLRSSEPADSRQTHPLPFSWDKMARVSGIYCTSTIQSTAWVPSFSLPGPHPKARRYNNHKRMRGKPWLEDLEGPTAPSIEGKTVNET